MSILIIPIALIIAFFAYRAISKGFQKAHGKAVSRFLAGTFSSCIFIFMVVSFILMTQPDIKDAKFSNAMPVKMDVAKVEQIPGLGFTSSEFLSRFKDVAEESNLKVNTKKIQASDNDGKEILNVAASKNMALLITSDKTSDTVISIILIGVGDGTMKSGGDIIIGFIAAITATNPELSKTARGDVLKSLGIFTGSNEANGETIRQGIKYTLSRTESAGTWLTISSEKGAS